MSLCKDFKLIKNDEQYIVEVYLNIEPTEFSQELITFMKDNVNEFDEQIRKIVKERFPDIKVTAVKLIIGAMVVGTMTFAHQEKVAAIEINNSAVVTSQQTTVNLAIITVNTMGTVTATKLNVRDGASTNDAIVSQLYQGNRAKVIGILGDWCEVQLSDGRIGWVSKPYIKLDIESTSRDQRINTVISTAQYLLGTPYVWGGESLAEGGFDCSGFVQYNFKKVGYTLNRISIDQSKQGKYVAKEYLQPGDLVFYSLAGNGVVSHVGIYIGNGKMIHSPKTGDVVKTTDITTSYWQSRFIVARRIF